MLVHMHPALAEAVGTAPLPGRRHELTEQYASLEASSNSSFDFYERLLLLLCVHHVLDCSSCPADCESDNTFLAAHFLQG